MTIAQTFDQILAEMEQTIHKLDDVIERMQKTQDDLKEATAMPRLLSDPHVKNLNEGPHFPGIG